MANLLHRTTKQYLVSTDPNGLPEPIANYIEEPDLSAVAGQPNKYWTITGDVVTLMSQAEQDAVDADIEAAKVLSDRATVVATPDNPNALGVEIRALIQLLNKRDNYLTNRVIELQDRVQAMCDSSGAASNIRTAGLAVSISATNTRSRSDAVQDYKDDTNAGVND